MLNRSQNDNFCHIFDDRNVAWRQLGDMSGFVISILDVDQKSNTVDFLAKFEPNTKVLYHRHLARTCTFVIEGVHVIYEPGGSTRESRPVGRYSVAEVTGDVHSEGGGPAGCVLFYSVRGENADLFEMLDDAFNPIGTFRVPDFQLLLDAQNA